MELITYIETKYLEKNGMILLYSSYTKHEVVNVFICFFVSLFEIESCCVAQAGLKLLILLPQPGQCWDYRHTPPHPAINYYSKVGQKKLKINSKP
jgi:hypothetical protein